jgi:hypothetical protein
MMGLIVKSSRGEVATKMIMALHMVVISTSKSTIMETWKVASYIIKMVEMGSKSMSTTMNLMVLAGTQ